MISREELITTIQRLSEFEALPAPQPQRVQLILELMQLVPHADISDLIYCAERERTYDEIADEALLRERLWRDGGDAAVRSRIRAQMLEVLGDPSIPARHPTKIVARTLLDEL